MKSIVGLLVLLMMMMSSSTTALISMYDKSLEPIVESSPLAIEMRRDLVVRNCSSVVVPNCALQGTRDVVCLSR